MNDPSENNLFIEKFNEFISRTGDGIPQPPDEVSQDVITEPEIDKALTGLEEVPTGSAILDEAE